MTTPYPLPRRHGISPAILEWLEQQAKLGPIEPWQRQLLEQNLLPGRPKPLPKSLRQRPRRPLLVPPTPKAPSETAASSPVIRSAATLRGFRRIRLAHLIRHLLRR